MARFQAFTLLALGLLAVCDGKLLSAATEKLKISVAKSLAQKRAPGRALVEECTGTSTSTGLSCTGNGMAETIVSSAYTSNDCSGDPVHSEPLPVVCEDTGGSWVTNTCSGGGAVVGTGYYSTSGCSGEPTTVFDPYQGVPGYMPGKSCICNPDVTADELLLSKAGMCFADCDSSDYEDPESCDAVAEFFARDCASDCTTEDKAVIAAALADPALASCPTFTGSASTATGLLFAALVSIGAVLLA
jgi:hypothetical protein